MKMQESGETYLETILLLEKRNTDVRAVDIARELNYSKPSVSRAISNFKKNGYISVIEDGKILLTDKGRSIADSIYEKHCAITEFLIKTLKLDQEEAEKNACRIEHIITDKCFNKIKDFINK